MALGEHLEEGVAEHLGIGLGHGSSEGVGDMRGRGLEGNQAIEEFLGIPRTACRPCPSRNPR